MQCWCSERVVVVLCEWMCLLLLLLLLFLCRSDMYSADIPKCYGTRQIWGYSALHISLHISLHTYMYLSTKWYSLYRYIHTDIALSNLVQGQGCWVKSIQANRLDGNKWYRQGG
jgi:hypothetical protein